MDQKEIYERMDCWPEVNLVLDMYTEKMLKLGCDPGKARNLLKFGNEHIESLLYPGIQIFLQLELLEEYFMEGSLRYNRKPNNDELEDIRYFKEKLMSAIKKPIDVETPDVISGRVVDKFYSHYYDDETEELEKREKLNELGFDVFLERHIAVEIDAMGLLDGLEESKKAKAAHLIYKTFITVFERAGHEWKGDLKDYTILLRNKNKDSFEAMFIPPLVRRIFGTTNGLLDNDLILEKVFEVFDDKALLEGAKIKSYWSNTPDPELMMVEILEKKILSRINQYEEEPSCCMFARTMGGICNCGWSSG